MNINSDLLDKLTDATFEAFFKEEVALILIDTSERALCARLLLQFEKQLAAFGMKGYRADVEYNRQYNGKIKAIIDGNAEVIQITCDLIVHSGGSIREKDNLIALEMAKPNKSAEDMESDRKRLMILTKKNYEELVPFNEHAAPEYVCGYMRGIYLIINRDKRLAEIEFYSEGVKVNGTAAIHF